MKKLFTKLRALVPSRRKIIQVYAALLFNANIKGFITGTYYTGPLKHLCSPGINCYSCPGAVGACPLGSLQSALHRSGRRTPYFIFGILLLYGILLGRFICGFLCPFGLIQELFHKIKTPKLKKNRFTRLLSYLKYVILVFLVGIVPLLYGLRNVALPGFCKYICPAGTIEGAMGLLSHKVNESMLAELGPLFTWKFALTVSFVVGSVFIFRFFCRFFCPLGALYGLFNKISIFGIKLEKSKCTSCGLCVAKCQMDVRTVGDQECISCGECIDVCPTGAIQWKGSRPFLAPSAPEIPEDTDEATIEIARQDFQEQTRKIAKRNKILKTVAAAVMAALLIAVVIIVNFTGQVETPPTTTPPVTGEGPVVGSAVGNLCPPASLPVLDENGISEITFDPAANKGKLTIINFWGTWCSGCIKELPYFDQIAMEYKDTVTVVAVHTYLDLDTAPDYIRDNYLNSDMLFVHDSPIDPNNKYSSEAYYTNLGGFNNAYPMTVVLDEEGIIVASLPRSVTYEELKELVDAQLN